ncbi:MAG TPA: carboxylesterase family protein [Gammaproteobacteria bacterium]|nr:carboxylesterase family protein [Gammaproteobacteria bacterium]
MKRRSFLKGSGAAVSSALLAKPGRAPGQSGSFSEVTTRDGRVRGHRNDSVHAFLGLPYAAPPTGPRRFLPPEPPTPWTGLRDALEYGQRAYQPFRPMIEEIGDAMTGTGPMSEDCLRLNVWTPATGPGDRPVMVWFHGGGFRTGSGNSPFYNGEQLARKHDVVVVTVNHRLNALGFAYLAESGDERLADSANLGMQDLVAALRWVRDNIAEFGGNPGNVTIFGQSGGGGKTSILQAMPSAVGLYHRAIIMSTLADTAVTALSRDAALEAADLLLARLGLRRARLEELQRFSAEQILAALSGGSGRSEGQRRGGRASPDGDLSLRFTPVVDGRVLVRHPFEPDASSLAADIPILCGSNETESVPYGNPDAPFWTSEPGDHAQLRAQVTTSLGVDANEADRLIALYRRNRPGDTYGDLALVMAADNSPLRLSSYTIAERKHAQGTAPVYMYYFKWRSPVRDGKLRSMHCMEIPFVFDHVDDFDRMTGTGDEHYGLAQRMSEAWVSFARTGNPNHDTLPHWPAFTPAERATMIFDAPCRTVNDPYGEERRALQALRV